MPTLDAAPPTTPTTAASARTTLARRTAVAAADARGFVVATVLGNEYYDFTARSAGPAVAAAATQSTVCSTNPVAKTVAPTVSAARATLAGFSLSASAT